MLKPVDDPQMPLRLQRMRDVDLSLVQAQPSLLSAIKLCVSLGGFEAEKQVYQPLKIDAGHWTRILRGEAHFPVDKLSDLMDLCANEVPLLWLVHARGYDAGALRKRETETEQALREANEALEEERRKVSYLSELLSGRAAR